MPDDEDCFDMPQSAFDAAKDSHGSDSPTFRVGMDVLTRGEVARLPANQLRQALIDWMWESPSELIPSNEQISAVRSILIARPEATEAGIQQLIVACDGYLEN